MAKAEKVIGLMPCIYNANDPSKLLNKVIRDLAEPLDEVDGHLFRIQRAHRINVAENLGDLIRLAALLRLGPEYFEDLVEISNSDYEGALDRVRNRIKQLAGIHLRGLGTPRSILESTSVLLDAEIIGAISNVSPDGLTHKVTIQLPEQPGGETDQIVLHENPLRRMKQHPVKRWPLDGWAVNNRNVSLSHMRFAIKGIGDRTILPSVFCSETDTGFLFNGVVPDGSVLLFDQFGSASIDGKPVDDWIIRFNGSVVGFDGVDASAVAVDHGKPGTPFNGDLSRLTTRPAVSKKPPLTLATGRTNWHFGINLGVYQSSCVGYCIYDTYRAAVGTFDDHRFDESVFDYEAHGEVGYAWNENVHCAFKLIVPQYTDSDDTEKDRDDTGRYVDRIGKFVSRFKAAGIRAYVSAERDAWVLGKSKIRSLNSTEGAGASYERPLLWREYMDRTLPFDTA